MNDKNILAIVIEPDAIPIPTYISNDIIELSKDVNIDNNGNRHPEFAPFEIAEIKNDINIISSPKGEERNLPVTRFVGEYTKLYGKIYIVNMKGMGDLYSLSNEDMCKYCRIFLNSTIPLSAIYDDNDISLLDNVSNNKSSDSNDYYDINIKSKDNGYRRVEITFDD